MLHGNQSIPTIDVSPSSRFPPVMDDSRKSWMIPRGYWMIPHGNYIVLV